MTTKAKYHHLTPQVYMRAWKHNESNEDSRVYCIEKNEENSLGISKRTSKFAGINNYHTIKAGYMIATEQNCNLFFEPIRNYTVMLEDKVIKDPIELNEKFNRFEDWIIKKENQVISKQERSDLKKEISSIHVKTIEEQWSNQYENYWHDIRKSIINHIPEDISVSSIPAISREDLIRFMVSLEWRTKPYHPILVQALEQKIGDNPELIKKLYGKEINLKTIQIPESERHFPFLETLFDEYAHNYVLKKYSEFLKQDGVIWIEAQTFIEKMHVNLKIAPEDGEFLTSDNPVCRFVNDKGLMEYVFPITPKILCSLYYKDEHDTYSISRINKTDVILYNNVLKENCHKHYFIREQKKELYFG